ncbi:hypothetical protein BKA70DRAFT_1222992 [Coprinopsis sp. MPI-PUGE-AT-0042]|nr:hypothetical protein BKA70DRAFT_1222992 [Coprinopsis sp. MPI-PUGE-AT-0042]
MPMRECRESSQTWDSLRVIQQVVDWQDTPGDYPHAEECWDSGLTHNFGTNRASGMRTVLRRRKDYIVEAIVPAETPIAIIVQVMALNPVSGSCRAGKGIQRPIHVQIVLAFTEGGSEGTPGPDYGK